MKRSHSACNGVGSCGNGLFLRRTPYHRLARQVRLSALADGRWAAITTENGQNLTGGLSNDIT